MNRHDLSAHLTRNRMAAAQRHLCTKALAELAHERLLEPEAHLDGYVVRGDDARVAWTFRARRLPLDHWAVEPSSVRRLVEGEPVEVDVRDLVLDVRSRLPLSETTLPVYLEELASTLQGRAWKVHDRAPTSADLLGASFQETEAAMTEGHPCFIANNGRLGLGATDYAAFAPETAAPVRLVWLAVRAEHAVVATSRDVPWEVLLGEELPVATRAAFREVLEERGLVPEDYVLLPCHPWQWDYKVAITFAPEVARGDIVLLGEGPDEYQAQQSVRTFHNRSHPGRRYVKTALSVLNMGFMRGLSPAYMEATPAINDWVHDVVTADPVLRARGFSVLREVAAIGYRHPTYEQVGRTAYSKMLSALWREPPVAAEGERFATMASLLHVDVHGRPLVAELVAASPLDARGWLRAYVDAYLVPLLHCFYAHRLVFMPHGENLIMALRDHVPTRVVMKDIGEEVAVLDKDADLPPGVGRVRVDVPEDLHLLSIFTDVFDCFFRHLAAVMDSAAALPADAFWDEIGAACRDYQAAHPELAERFARHDLFAPTFPLSCLNRLQLRNNQEMVDLSDPAAGLAVAGELANPLAGTAAGRQGVPLSRTG